MYRLLVLKLSEQDIPADTMLDIWENIPKRFGDKLETEVMLRFMSFYKKEMGNPQSKLYIYLQKQITQRGVSLLNDPNLLAKWADYGNTEQSWDIWTRGIRTRSNLNFGEDSANGWIVPITAARIDRETYKIECLDTLGTVIATDVNKSATIEFVRKYYIQKYERYEKRKSKVKAHNPESVNAKEGDVVRIRECRPISKTKNFIVVEVLGKERGFKERMEAEEESKSRKPAKEETKFVSLQQIEV